MHNEICAQKALGHQGLTHGYLAFVEGSHNAREAHNFSMITSLHGHGASFLILVSQVFDFAGHSKVVQRLSSAFEFTRSLSATPMSWRPQMYTIALAIWGFKRLFF